MVFVNALYVVATIIVALSPTFAQRPKILALHGGGGSAAAFGNDFGMKALEAALPGFEFVYAQGGYYINDESYLWIPDPPSKNDPTTSPNIADKSVANLNLILQEQGPFFGILGYSQGAAFVPVYLANAPTGSFQKAMMFCGYLTETHLGLLDKVQEASPFGDISSLIWIGKQDSVIAESFSRDLIPEFTSPTVIASPNGGHIVPETWDSTFSQVVAFFKGDPPTPIPPPVDKPNDEDSKCVDDSTFRHKNKKGKTCKKWVAKHPDGRCNINWKNKKISAYCPKTCGQCKDKPNDEDSKCVDDSTFRYKNKKGKTCKKWVAKHPDGRCNINWKNKKISAYCPKTCGQCKDSKCIDDSTFRHKNQKGKTCKRWVAENPDGRCNMKWRKKKISTYCPLTCSACEK